MFALRNLLEYAPHVPLEARRPIEVFDRLLAQFPPIAAIMASEEPFRHPPPIDR
jgi:hypothetical protein